MCSVIDTSLGFPQKDSGVSYSHKGLNGNYDDIYFDKTLREYINWLESKTGIDVSTLGTGARNGERIKIKELIRR